MKAMNNAYNELVVIKNILKKTKEELKDLEEKAGEVFFEKGVGGLESVLIKKARVIIDLPKEMAMYLEHTPEVAERLRKFSEHAKELLIDNDFWGLCTLLDPEKQGGKNEFEKIIDLVKKK